MILDDEDFPQGQQHCLWYLAIVPVTYCVAWHITQFF